jgi:hypothetical protein
MRQSFMLQAEIHASNGAEIDGNPESPIGPFHAARRVT